MRAVVGLQRLIWADSETDIVPTHLLITLEQNGSPVLGAYDPENTTNEDYLLGFIYGFPGWEESPDDKALKFCSHQMGVHPDYQGQGIGFALKCAQRQTALDQDYQHITWTYDPLLSRNAYLNIYKLGGICKTYKRNIYGLIRDSLNVGLDTDRFQVDWWLNSPRVEKRLSPSPRPGLSFAKVQASGSPVVNPARSTPQGWPSPRNLSQLDNGNPRILVEIPPDFLALKAANIELAKDWRSHTRVIFEEAFKLGYAITDFIYTSSPQARSFYVLDKIRTQPIG